MELLMTGRKIGCQSRNGRSTGKETCRGEMEGKLLEMDGLWSENNAVTTHIRDCLPEILGGGPNSKMHRHLGLERPGGFVISLFLGCFLLPNLKWIQGW